MSAGAALRPFFSYYGGKWQAAPRYPAPLFGTVVEPFAGSAGYAVRYPHRNVVLYDLDPVIVGVWEYLIGASPAEILALPDVCVGQSATDLPVCQEARWLIGFWLNRGSSGPRQSPSAWMRSGIRPGSFWGPAARATIASQVGQIRHWQVIHGSYESAPDVEATWFVDPPYQLAGRHYRCGSAGIDYPALGEWCRARTGQMIVCENEGADWLPFRPFLDAKTTRAGARSAEVVWEGGCGRQSLFGGVPAG